MKNKKAQVPIFLKVILILVACGVILLFLILLLDIFLNKPTEKECFENIAKEYCQKQGYKFHKVNYFLKDKTFECSKDRRILDEFKLTKKEIDNCIIWDWFN